MTLSRLACLAVLGFGAAAPARALGKQALTSAPVAPFRVEGSQLLDGHGKPFVIRGTGLAEFDSRREMAADEFGPLSGTVLSIVRQPWNMNAVRQREPAGWIRLPLAILTFALVTLGWVFFRVGPFDRASFVIGQMFSRNPGAGLWSVWQTGLALFALAIELFAASDTAVPFVYFQF